MGVRFWSMLGLRIWIPRNCRWGTATSKPSASPARSAHSPHGVGRRSRKNINQIAAKKQVGSTTGVNVWELRNLHSFMNVEGWSFWWGLPYCITIQDQVGSTACPKDTQHLLVEKRRNPSRHVDSRPAQKQVEMGVERLLMFVFVRSKFDKQMFKLEDLKS